MNANPKARLAEIEAEREALLAQIAERDAEKRAEALAIVRESVARWNFAEKEIRSKPAEPRTALEPKYRDPETGETWPGRGRMPNWLNGRIEAGAKLEDFAIVKCKAPAAAEATAAPTGEAAGAATSEAPAGEPQDPFVTHCNEKPSDQNYGLAA